MVSRETPLEHAAPHLMLVEVDPHRARAFWSVEPSVLDQAREQAGPDAPMVLRIYDITGSAPGAWTPDQVFDVEVQGLSGSWYIDLWRPERTFGADLGLLGPGGELVPLARSNEIDTPPSPEEPPAKAVADETPEEPVTVVEPEPVSPPSSGLAPPGPIETDRDAPPAAPGDDDFPLVFWGDAAPLDSEADPGVRVALEDARAHPSMMHEPPAPEESKLRPLDQVVEAEPPRLTEPDTDMPADMQSHPDAPAGDSPDRYAGWPSGDDLLQHGPPPSSPEASQAAEPPGSSEPFAPDQAAPSGDASAPKPLPLESVVHLSSSESGKPDVLLEVNAELHVYGRARPNTELSLYGQKVRTRPDGTFSVRKPLPRGALVLPLTYTEEP